MLQDCYDKLMKDASLEANPAAVRREELRQVFREIRRVHAPAVSKATPEQFIDDPTNVPAEILYIEPRSCDGKSWSKGKTFVSSI
jgi:hypothetical protein